MKKFISKLISVLLILVTVWFVGSFAEVISKNLEPNPQYSKANMFCILTELEQITQLD
jgi:type II secretory pathway component PulC